MTEEYLIDAEHVSKKFCMSLHRSLWYGVRDIVRSINPRPNAGNGAESRSENEPIALPLLRTDEFWALQDISFRVRRGECLGLIGHNGAGKSTLLKILNGLIRPDTGTIRMRGRVGALIELSAGFNPILTGRENIFNQAALLGFSHNAVKARFDAIVDFAGTEEFLDTPVQNYSSGMQVRLGFAVAAQMEPDILLIDEVLAVGDVGFRAKCLARMGELRERCAFVFVSHSMPQIARISTGVLHLDHGRTHILTDSLSEGLQSYYSGFESAQSTLVGTGQVNISSLGVIVGGEERNASMPVSVAHGQSIDFLINCEFESQIDCTIQLVIWSQEMIPVMDVLGNNLSRFRLNPRGATRCSVRAHLDEVMLNSGRFFVSIVVLSLDGTTTICQLDRAIDLDVTSNMGSACSISLSGNWSASFDEAVA